MSMGAGYPPRSGRGAELFCGVLTLLIGLAWLSWSIDNMVDNGVGNLFHAMFYFPTSGANQDGLYAADPGDLIFGVAALIAGGYLLAGRRAARGAAITYFGVSGMGVLPRMTAFIGDSDTRNVLTHGTRETLLTATNIAVVVFGIVVVLTLVITGAQARSRARFGGTMPAPGGYHLPGQYAPPPQPAPWANPPGATPPPPARPPQPPAAG